MEVPDEIAAVMEECRLYENRQEGRKSQRAAKKRKAHKKAHRRRKQGRKPLIHQKERCTAQYRSAVVFQAPAPALGQRAKSRPRSRPHPSVPTAKLGFRSQVVWIDIHLNLLRPGGSYSGWISTILLIRCTGRSTYRF